MKNKTNKQNKKSQKNLNRKGLKKARGGFGFNNITVRGCPSGT